jgi:hypothetical protein
LPGIDQHVPRVQIGMAQNERWRCACKLRPEPVGAIDQHLDLGLAGAPERGQLQRHRIGERAVGDSRADRRDDIPPRRPERLAPDMLCEVPAQRDRVHLFRRCAERAPMLRREAGVDAVPAVDERVEDQSEPVRLGPQRAGPGQQRRDDVGDATVVEMAGDDEARLVVHARADLQEVGGTGSGVHGVDPGARVVADGRTSSDPTSMP